ncbi:MAG TPA: GNAT family N-acetyltransferase [Rudaea sp.]|nr:GNAT family N-acetyltransferase [Rudaea sp.]
MTLAAPADLDYGHAADIDALARLVPAWWELWLRLPDATPFQSPAWLLPWARRYAPGRTSAIAFDDLRALALYFVWRRSLLLAGTGPSDYCEVLCPAADAPKVLEALCRSAVERDCETVDLQQLPANSPLRDAPAPRGWSSDVTPGVTCPVVTLADGDGLARVSAKWRRNLRRAERILLARGDVELGPASHADVAAAPSTFEALHARRYGSEAPSAVFADPLMRAFFADVVPALDAAGLLRVTQVKASGQTIAAVLVLQCRRAAHFYMSAFDPAWSRYSPGAVALAAAMRRAAAEGAGEFHFLRGGELYKYHFGARDVPTWRRVLHRA